MGKMYVSATAVLLALLLTGNPEAATGKKRDRTTVFEVPTTGKIVDVVYHPEFDEWWVKCREGDQICVYTYDHRLKEWGKVQFVPKKAEDQGKKAERVRSNVEGDTDQNMGASHKADETRSEPSKPTGKVDQRPDRKWWDPLRILKSGEKLIFPSSSEGTK